nr:hypothetical protein Iba_chr14aCG17300 [Ipomoea batatas]
MTRSDQLPRGEHTLGGDYRLVFPHFAATVGTLAIDSRSRNGEVEEPHSSQPVLQGPQKWHQEAQKAPPYLHQRDGSQVLEEPEVCQKAQQQEWRGLR